MSIQTEITRINEDIKQCYTICEALQADIPIVQNLDNLIPTIATIGSNRYGISVFVVNATPSSTVSLTIQILNQTGSTKKAYINWGDGTTLEYNFDSTPLQVWQMVELYKDRGYAVSGKYVITLSTDEGLKVRLGGKGGSETSIGDFSLPEAEQAYLANSIEYLYPYQFYRNTTIQYIHLPNTITSFGTEVFRGAINLRKINLSSNALLTTLPANTFYQCSGLTEIDIPSNIKNIGNNCFSSCFYLENIRFNEGLESIGNYAFERCNYQDKGIKKIFLPSTLATLGSYIFAYCGVLEEIHFKSTTPPTCSSSLGWLGNQTPNTIKIYVPRGTLEAYTSAPNYPDPDIYTYIEE